MSDSASVCSSHSAMSLSLAKIECPHCQKDLQARGLFNHIRKLHKEEFLKSTRAKWIQEAEAGQPLRVYWTKTNDFDEEEDVIIFVCLATNKTFMTMERANRHFEADKKLLKQHNKELKELKKDYATFKKEQEKKRRSQEAKDPQRLRLHNARQSNDPMLARALWRGILHHKQVIEKCFFVFKKQGYMENTTMYVLNPKTHKYVEVSFTEFQHCFSDLEKQMNELLEQKSLNVKVLENLYFKMFDFWHASCRESMFDFTETMKNVGADLWPGRTDEFFGYANEKMEGIEF